MGLHSDSNPLRGLLKDGGLPSLDTQSQPIYPDGCPSRSTACMGLHPDGDPSGGFLKDGGSLTLDARSQSIMGYTLIAARAGQSPIWVFTLTVILREAS